MVVGWCAVVACLRAATAEAHILTVGSLGLAAVAAGRTTKSVVPRASAIQVSGPIDEPQPVELRASLELPDGAEAQLPISVEPRSVGVDGDGAPRVVAITTDARAGVYGAGQNFTLFVDFTAPVAVVGDPGALGLELATGCDDDGCSIKEMQTFTCTADSGKFAATLREARAASFSETSRGDGCRVDCSAETSRGDAAGAAWIVRAGEGARAAREESAGEGRLRRRPRRRG